MDRRTGGLIRALNDPRPPTGRRPAGPDGSPDLRAILDVPTGIVDPVLDSPRLRQQLNAGRYPVLVAIELAREMGDPRAEQDRLPSVSGSSVTCWKNPSRR